MTPSRGGRAESLFIALQRLLPQHGLSRLVGAVAEAHWLRRPLIEVFSRVYGVDLSEAGRDSPSAYGSFNDFFTRELKAGARPLAGDARTAVCPADGSVSQAGRIADGRLLQAKGHRYSLAALLGEPERSAARFEGGTFATIYLAPRDYHRVHLPIAGRLTHTRAIPGALYSVNATTEAGIEGLFARNERLVCRFETEAGGLVVVLIGAMIVAGIQTVWPGPASPYGRIEDTCHDGPSLARGAEIGRFFLGSTVIVCTEPGRATLAAGIGAGATVKMGQALFDLTGVGQGSGR
jgi:phosphatidylserine decarboxylase